MKDINMNTTEYILLYMQNTIDIDGVFTTGTLHEGYTGYFPLLTPFNQKVSSKILIEHKNNTIVFAKLLQSIGHNWGVSQLFKTGLSSKIKKIIINLIREYKDLINFLIDSFNTKYDLEELIIKESKDKFYKLPIIPIEYQSFYSLRKTSPPIPTFS